MRWCIFLFVILLACGKKDIRLMNEINSLDAKWIRVSGDVSEMKRKFPFWKEDLETSVFMIREGNIQDSLLLDSVIRIQRSLVQEMSGLEKEFFAGLPQFMASGETFNQWQLRVLKNPPAHSELKLEFQEQNQMYETARTFSDSISQRVQKIIQQHNQHREFVHSLSEMMQYPQLSFK